LAKRLAIAITALLVVVLVVVVYNDAGAWKYEDKCSGTTVF
jgi:hypothetical protein